MDVDPQIDRNIAADNDQIIENAAPLEDALAEDGNARKDEENRIPPITREGYTRNIQSNDLLVCPTCDHELGTTSEDYEKQDTLWAGKCGHVYCGKCAAVKLKRGRCDVEDCNVNLRGKGLWEIFLS